MTPARHHPVFAGKMLSGHPANSVKVVNGGNIICKKIANIEVAIVVAIVAKVQDKV